MKATIPLFRINRLAFVSVSASVLVFFSWNAREKISSLVSFPNTSIPAASEVASQSLPFLYDDAVRYFEDSLGYRAQQRFANQVIFRGGVSAEDFYTITVTRRGPGLLVAFEVVDDYGMSLVREFFEAPFFQRAESEQFYTMLNGRDLIRTLHLARFNVIFEYSSPGLEANITMIFSPRSRSLSIP